MKPISTSTIPGSKRTTAPVAGVAATTAHASGSNYQSRSSAQTALDSDAITNLRALIASQICLEDLQAAVSPLAKQELIDSKEGSIPVSTQSREAKIRAALQSSGLIDRLSDQVYGRIHKDQESNSVQNPPFLLPGTLGTTQAEPSLQPNTTTTTYMTASRTSNLLQKDATPVVVNGMSTGLTRTKRGYKYLNICVERGRAFIGHAEIEEDPSSSISIHLLFGSQRFVTPLVMSRIEPHFNSECLFELPMKELSVLADSSLPIHVVAIRTDAVHRRTVIGTSIMDWRKVLYSGTASLVVELKDISNPQMSTGLLEVRVTLFPAQIYLLSREEVQFHLQRDQRQDAEANRLFFVYAKQWWADFVQVRPEHADRLVKIFANSELGTREPVTNFITPLKSRWIESPRHAARFVSLLGYDQLQTIGDTSKTEIWQQLHTVLVAGQGDTHDHALLLCSLFLGFAIDAYVVLGTDKNNLAHIWVATIDPTGGVSFWESLTGVEYKKPLKHHFRTVGCCFNADCFYANIQASDAAEKTEFVFQDQKQWKELSKDALASMKRINGAVLPVQLGPSLCGNPEAQEIEMESALRQYISHYREDHDLTTVWDEDLSHLLGQSLWACEHQKLTGPASIAAFSNDFHVGIKRSIPEGHTFKRSTRDFHVNSTTGIPAASSLHLRKPNLVKILLSLPATRLGSQYE
ncbi:hypothetical protein BASA83_010398 [Batrachochytrium salamandrivorans]|nr:hypothetical protein BASA62_006115 [Batrachochytrium salamandrivorans]KAH9266720.1 hypothetical protein BASA83_010398 [Batrachochytrium salamandrivorans]